MRHRVAAPGLGVMIENGNGGLAIAMARMRMKEWKLERTDGGHCTLAQPAHVRVLLGDGSDARLLKWGGA